MSGPDETVTEEPDTIEAPAAPDPELLAKLEALGLDERHARAVAVILEATGADDAPTVRAKLDELPTGTQGPSALGRLIGPEGLDLVATVADPFAGVPSVDELDPTAVPDDLAALVFAEAETVPETIWAELPADLGETLGELVGPEIEAADTIAAGARLRRDAASLARYVSEARSPETRAAYLSDLRIWARFCRERRADPRDITAERVASWASAMADEGLAVSTIRRRVSALSVAGEILRPDLPRVSRSRYLREALAGIEAVLGVEQSRERDRGERRQAPARGLSRAELVRMLNGCADDPAGIRDRALLLVGWYGGLRRSELVGLCAEDIDRSEPEGYAVKIRGGKGQRGKERLVWLAHIGGPADPLEALDRWLALAEITEGPIFRGVHRSGRILESPLTGQSVRLVLRRRAEAVGVPVDRLSGHSLRRGMITAAAAAGVPEHTIAAQSGHRSVAMLRRYIEQPDRWKVSRAIGGAE